MNIQYFNDWYDSYQERPTKQQIANYIARKMAREKKGIRLGDISAWRAFGEKNKYFDYFPINKIVKGIKQKIEADQKKLKVHCKCGKKMEHIADGITMCTELLKGKFITLKESKKHDTGSSEDLALWKYIESLKTKL